ncbi:patatin-like phospholipase family protein [Nocardioides sp. R-C-SC26]|uniref:patatin-like phospholipase family protein n=1 Tax=Nocardioides sp. R-C-SC26 TaxID=2870414 RepID=UPI001E50139F|nr:patatin-like phospholipase family protein [Nocardioides sp. R-C-SC26]
MTRALVLGGGGITGIAWETGLLAGLADAGIDLTAADRVIGTSAGSIVGAQITGGLAIGELYARQQAAPGTPGVDGAAPLAAIGRGVAVQFAWCLLRARGDIERFGRLLGRRAVAAARAGTVPSVEERYSQVALRIGGLEFGDRDLRVTGVDVETGKLAVFGPHGTHADVSLEDAVNASCAVPCVYPPIPIRTGGAVRVFVDGGVRSGGNADLAAGCDVAVVLSPLDRSIGPVRSAGAQLRDLGIPHVVITPDDAARAAIGPNVLDPAARPGSARAGYAQAALVADAVREVWDG